MEVKEFLEQFEGQRQDALPYEIFKQKLKMQETGDYHMTPEIEKFIKEHYKNLKECGFLREDK